MPRRSSNRPSSTSSPTRPGPRSGRALGRSLVALVLLATTGCAGRRPDPDLGRLYDVPAQRIGDDRVPVIVLPGILGSKLNHRESGLKIWGAFTREASDADTADGARDIALPMAEGRPLADLRDDGVPDDVLDFIVADVGPLRGIKVAAYVDILMTLAAGKYRDRSLGESGAIDYGGQHYTCFQYPYDWRRDVSESAVALHEMILDSQRRVRDGRGLPADAPVKVDVVAHSMGGLVLRYYLRYGTQPLPEDGSLPPITWAGAKHVARAFLVGTPSAGSVESLQQLVDGLDLNPLFPNYRPGVLGTMPAIYQLLPRPRHGRVVDAATGEPIDVLDVDVWREHGWGLAGESRELDRVLRWLLPDAASDAERRRIAVDHLEKCLARAEQFFRALDVPASPPPGTELHLFAGDGDETPSVLAVDTVTRRVSPREEAPGDGTVTRASALMDERTGGTWNPGLRSPIDWHRVQFLSQDHLGLTKSAEFADNLLYLMLEDPRD